MNEKELARESLAKKISGEVVLSEFPGKTLKKWREIFKIPQHILAKKVGVMPSVISDYESGRRKSPGIMMIKKIIVAMIEIDESSGGTVLKEFSSIAKESITTAVLDMREFAEPVKLDDFLKTIDGELVCGQHKEIYGYSIIDSIKAIINSTPDDLVKIYGSTTERALIFTKVTTGRSPMVAIKVTNMRPALVVLQGVKNVDEIAKRIAEAENIALAKTALEADKIVEILRKKYS